MPIYEYQCANCNERLEVIQKISDKPLKKCPACGKMKLRKLISRVGFRLKGSGWYETDFKDRKPSKPQSGGDEKPADTSAAREKPAAGKTGTAADGAGKKEPEKKKVAAADD